MRKLATGFGARVSQIACLLALALSVFASPSFAASAGNSQLAVVGHAMSHQQMVGSHHMDVSVSTVKSSCAVESGAEYETSGAHEHLGSACCAGNCMDAMTAFKVSDFDTSVSQRFVHVSTAILTSGEWVNPHRPPNS